MALIVLLLALLVLAVIIVWWIVSIYNSLIIVRERVENAKAQIVTQIESRWDAISSLIEATKKYSTYESTILETITEKRTSLGKGCSVRQIENSENEFNSVIRKLLAVTENYPDLKANQLYDSTMSSINKFEDNVRLSRMIYNDIVTKFNRLIKVFPSSIVARRFKFEEAEYYQGTETKKEMPNW